LRSTIIHFLCRYSVHCLLGGAHSKFINANFLDSFQMSVDGLQRCISKRDSFLFCEFFLLAVKSASKLKDASRYKELAALVITPDFPKFSPDESKPLLFLAKRIYDLELYDLSREIVELSIAADSKNAEAWFVSGWLILETDEEQAANKIRRSVELDSTMVSRIQQDERCKRFPILKDVGQQIN